MLITSAPAQIAFQGVTNFVVGRSSITLEELVTGQNHAWRAEATLQTVLFPETLLRRVEIAILGQPLNRGNLSPVSLNCQHRAGFDRRPIQHDCAGSTHYVANSRSGFGHQRAALLEDRGGLRGVMGGAGANDNHAIFFADTVQLARVYTKRALLKAVERAQA